MPRQQYTRELKIATMRELEAGKSIAHVAQVSRPPGSVVEPQMSISTHPAC
jgi:hypothetical protein